jgi:arylsulfatase A-like enzyme
MISLPSQRHAGSGRRIAEAVELVDVYPTLRQLLVPSMEVPGLEGRSLVPMLATATAKQPTTEMASAKTPEQAADGGHPGLAFSSAGGGSPLTHFRSVQNERFKVVFHPARKTRNGERPELWQLFDLVADPGEENDLLAVEPLTAEQEKALRFLRRQLVDWMAGRLWIRPPKEQIEAHNEEMEKTLRALGYIQ